MSLGLKLDFHVNLMLVIFFRLHYHKVRHPFWFEFGCGDLIIPDLGAFSYVKMLFLFPEMPVFSWV